MEILTRLLHVGTRTSGAPQGFTTPKVDRREGAETTVVISLLPDFKNGNHGFGLVSDGWIKSQ
jgi:hypothetical protein